MFFDLYHPFPLSESAAEASKKTKNKGKGKAPAVTEKEGQRTSCWDGIPSSEREGVSRSISLAGHLGYNVVGCTITTEPSSTIIKSPFVTIPFPELDPRHQQGESSRSSSSIVQVTRYHMRLDDAKSHCLNALNTNALRDYDILSVSPTSDKALQLACTDLALPGPNQISIITLPLHEKPYHFRLNRKQMRLAQRQGVVFEILYAAALFPSQASPETARRYRQNFMSNAREIIRITEGKGVIFSSGPGGSGEGLRGPMDLVNLGTVLGMPANIAKDSVSLYPKMLLLRAQARKTHKAILSMPVMVPLKRTAEDLPEQESKRPKV